MSRRWWWPLAVLVWSVTAWADTVDLELEKKFRAEVAAASPAAADEYDQGNTARAARKFEEAIPHYQRAIELAPNVDHPHRRLCGMLEGAGRDDEGIAECETALKLSPDSPYDKLGLAAALSGAKTPREPRRALELARAGVDKLPRDPSALGTWCTILFTSRFGPELEAELGSCVTRLLDAAPDDMRANVFGAAYAASKGNFTLAQQRLDKAHSEGLPDDAYRNLSLNISQHEGAQGQSSSAPLSWDTVLVGVWIIAAWLGLLVVLVIVGFTLSRLTLRALATGGDAQRLRKVYRAVLVISGVYFYASLPILLATIVFAGGGAIYMFIAAGYIPIKLVLLIAILVIATVGAILKSLFARVKPGPLGERLDVAAHPKLGKLLDEVATTVGTRAPDAVYLTPGTDMAVTERAGLWASLRGKRSERSLIMGVGLFEGMTQLQLRSVLAHEHGHFRNEDTAGGGFALNARHSLVMLIVGMARSGAASALNPVWWFARAYYRVYLGISQGASRLQEVLADRWAVDAYGSDAFVAAYTHVVARSVRFEREADATIREVVAKKAPLPNLYQYTPEKGPAAGDLDAAIDKEMSREPDRYDSHPSPRQRVDFAKSLAVVHVATDDDDAPLWSLFEDREALEREMTREVRARVRKNHGLNIVEDAP